MNEACTWGSKLMNSHVPTWYQSIPSLISGHCLFGFRAQVCSEQQATSYEPASEAKPKQRTCQQDNLSQKNSSNRTKIIPVLWILPLSRLGHPVSLVEISLPHQQWVGVANVLHVRQFDLHLAEIRSEQLERASDMYTGLESIDRLYLVLAFSFVASTKVVTLDVALATLAKRLFLSSWRNGLYNHRKIGPKINSNQKDTRSSFRKQNCVWGEMKWSEKFSIVVSHK